MPANCFLHSKVSRPRFLGSLAVCTLLITFCLVPVATGLDASLAPVGEAWALARQENPLAALWSGDHSHPSLEGS
ncbi:hypothetical protein H8D51_02125 [bacterium]|nr:hypothetical protein [bacterium]